MHDIKICRPRIEDKEEIIQFFDIVIRDTFVQESLEELYADMENEIEVKKQYLQSDLDSGGIKRYFLIALMDDNLVGTIEYGPASELINRCTDGVMKELVEVGTVLVRPDYQENGIGSLLLNAMCLTLLGRGIEEFCLDCGYAKAQQIWKKKLGKPNYLLRNYWSEGGHHMIWRKKISDIPIVFSI